MAKWHHLRLNWVLGMMALVLAGGFFLAGCARSRPAAEEAMANDTPSATALPPLTETATAIPPATETPTAQPPATETPAASPTPTLTATPALCAVPLSEELVPYWNRDEVGCARGEAVMLWLAEEEFEDGRMFWREDDGRIYVLYDDDLWAVYDDTWSEGDPEYSCGVEQSPPTPLRGFGKVWCSNPDVQDKLGDATTFEYGRYGLLQVFEHGFIIQPPFGIYVIHEDGSWK
jgi:hypothetical protein